MDELAVWGLAIIKTVFLFHLNILIDVRVGPEVVTDPALLVTRFVNLSS